MTFRELCAKEIVQLSNGACLGRADDLELDQATAQVEACCCSDSPGCSGFWAGRDAGHPLDGHRAIGMDAILVRTELPEPEAKNRGGFLEKMRHWLDG